MDPISSRSTTAVESELLRLAGKAVLYTAARRPIVAPDCGRMGLCKWRKGAGQNSQTNEKKHDGEGLEDKYMKTLLGQTRTCGATISVLKQSENRTLRLSI